MILVHTLFVLSVIAGSGFAAAAPQSPDTAKDGSSTTSPPEPSTTAKAEVTTEESKGEPPKNAAKPEGEKKPEPADAKSATAKILKEGVETSGDKVVSEESLISAMDKIVDIIHGQQGVGSKPEALPLSLGEKFDFLLLKIPRIKEGKKGDESSKKPKDDVLSKDVGGQRNLGETTDASPLCATSSNDNCPCLQQGRTQMAPAVQEPATNFNSFKSPKEYGDSPCAQAQQQQRQQQLLQSEQFQNNQLMAGQLQQMPSPSYRFLGSSEYDLASRGMDFTGFTQNYGQPPYIQPLPAQNADYYGSNNFYKSVPSFQNGLDAYGTPYPYIASLYPEAQRPSSNWNSNNNNMYGFPEH